MKRFAKWCATGLTAILLMIGTVFEASSHIARGWLRGEAFYDGRPTAYWRGKLDHWRAQFIEPDDAIRAMVLSNGADAVDGIVIVRPEPHPVWGHVQRLLQSQQAREREWDTPDILLGNPAAVPVLRELARDEKYRAIAERALN